jgi:hypothetical protein
MTIAISLQCSDGIVMGADRLFTHSDGSSLGAFGSYAKKVFGGESWNASAILTGSGSKDSLYYLSERLLERFNRETSADNPRTIPLKQDLEDELNLLSKKKGTISNLSILIALSQRASAPQVFRSDGLIVRSAEPVELAGIGETSLVRFLTDTLYRPTMNLKQGTALATLVLKLTKTYCPQYCEGQTDIHCLPKGEDWWYDVSGEEINDMEGLFEHSIENRLSEAINQAADILK